MKKFFKRAVLFLALYMMIAQVVSLSSGMRGQTGNTNIQIAGDRDILSPDPICVVKING